MFSVSVMGKTAAKLLGLSLITTSFACSSPQAPPEPPHDSVPEAQRNAPNTQDVDATPDQPSAQAPAQAPEVEPAPLAEPAPPAANLTPLNPRSIAFDDACAPGDRITIAAVGDVLVHKMIQVQATKHEDRFRSLWSDVQDLLSKADLTYANLEGPTAPGVTVRQKDVKDPGLKFDDSVYTSYPRFNYHPSLLDDLKASGVDIVSTANNHALDRGPLGVDRTIEQLERVKLPFTGTRRSDHKKEDVSDKWYTITEANGFKIAWVACTFSTNGLPDRHAQVLFCYEQRKEVLDTIKALAQDKSIDAVIATPHWGWEYTQRLRKQDVDLAHDLIDAGALAVVASHPHVLQKWERYQAKDGRATFIIYSLGNFVSGMDELEERATMILYLGLTRRKDDGKVVVNGARYVPAYMYWGKTRRYVQDIERGEGASKALAHITDLLGSYNLYKTADPWTTTPQCSASWTPPIEAHAHNGWLGGACLADEDCAAVEGAVCDLSKPQGFCALPCQGSCPGKKGRASTFCAPDPAKPAQDEASICQLRCNKPADCRPGYTCAPQPQYGKPSRERRVCVPAPSTP